MFKQPEYGHVYYPPVHSFDEAYRATLAAVLRDGHDVKIGSSLSTAAGRTTIELLNYSFLLERPSARLAVSASRPFNIFAAVGRLAWLLSGSNLLREIVFYDGAAQRFSDDGMTVPGSSDGARLIAARPGQNQLQKVTELLRDEENTRRAAVVIYMPEDVGRVSADIPCTISLVFNLREDRLHITTLMRANNALTVLPYDVFQFSMLGELVAAQLSVDSGTYFHLAASMHIYADDRGLARSVADERVRTEASAMPAMPRGNALAQANEFAAAEARIRALAMADRSDALVGAEIAESVEELGEYWAALARVVLIWAILKTAKTPNGVEVVDTLCSKLPSPLDVLAHERVAREV